MAPHNKESSSPRAHPFRWFALWASCFIALPGFATSLTVFAAASLTDSLKEIAAAYEKQSGHKLVFNFAASSFLARQIEEGAPADVFFSADETKMDQLEKKNLLRPGTRQKLLGNSLVVVTAADSKLAITNAHDLLKANRIALAEPKTVPAGIYAMEYLAKRKLTATLKPKILPTDNVRAALSAVEAGNAEAGIVYKTDAGISKKVKVAFEVPLAESPDISYPVAVLKDSKSADAAKDFLRYLASEKGRKVFESFGFIVRR